jgi:lysyl-tRNA synthetase class 2
MADINELKEVRKEKMQKLIDEGISVHPERYERTHSIKEARELDDGTKEVSIAGRVMSKRKLGKISFMDLQDIEGHLQLCIKRDDLGEDVYKFMHETIDIGDFIGVKGDIFTTQAGEKSLQVYEYTFLGKVSWINRPRCCI